jgi:hypothetical protein
MREIGIGSETESYGSAIAMALVGVDHYMALKSVMSCSQASRTSYVKRDDDHELKHILYIISRETLVSGD